MKRILGFVGWLGVLLVVAAVALRFLRPEMQSIYKGLALAGLITTLAYAASQWRDVTRQFGGKNVKYGSIAASSVLLVLAILVGLNYVANRQNKRWDLTENKQFSLSDQTKKIVTGLTKPVVVRVFYAGDAQRYRDSLGEYPYLSKQLTAEYIDAERDPIQAQKYGISTVPTAILEYEGRTERASTVDESGLTNALKKLTEGKAKKIYFTEGHGEHDPTASDPAGYSGITDSLKSDNFDIVKTTIAQAGKVPDDATLVVVAGPTVDFFPAELDAIRAYLKRGGKLALFIDPPAKADAAPFAGLIALAKEWGVDVGNDIVLDTSGLGQLIGTDASVPIARPVTHPITDRFRLMSGFPIARSVTPIEGGTGGHIAQKFLETSTESWAENDIKELYATGKPTPDFTKGDKKGPIALGAAVAAAAPDAPAGETPDAPKPETRVVIVGDSDFATNRAINIPGNRDITLNMANWLAQQEDLIAIRPKDPSNRPVAMTADQGAIIFWSTMVGLPLLLFGMAVRVWWKKR